MNLRSVKSNPIPTADQVSHCYSFSWQIHRNHVGLDARKPVFGGQRTTQAQTSLHRSAPLLFTYWKVPYKDLIVGRNFFFLQLVSVAEQADLNLTLSETPKTGFLASPSMYECNIYMYSTGQGSGSKVDHDYIGNNLELIQVLSIILCGPCSWIF